MFPPNSIAFKGRSHYSEEDLLYSESWLDKMSEALLLRNGVYSLIDNQIGIVETSKSRNIISLPEFYNKIKDYDILNLAITTDTKGMRGSSIFNKENKKYIKKLKEAGIKTVIDLRAEAGAKSEALCTNNGLKYVGFPIMYDHKISDEALSKFPEFISAINQGDYYIGCSMGIDRTDAALGLNYIFNKDCGVIPEFLSFMPNLSYSMTINTVNEIPRKLKSGNNSYNEEFIKKLKWESVREFEEELPERIRKLNPSTAKDYKY